MALRFSRAVANRLPALAALDASGAVVASALYTVAAGDVVNDIVEMYCLPNGMEVVDAKVDVSGLGAGSTLDAGILSGEYLDSLQTRTMGNEFFAAQAAANASVIRMTKPTTAIASDLYTDRGFGIKFLGANPTVGATIKMHVIMRPNTPALAA